MGPPWVEEKPGLWIGSWLVYFIVGFRVSTARLQVHLKFDLKGSLHKRQGPKKQAFGFFPGVFLPAEVSPSPESLLAKTRLGTLTRR